MNRKIEPAVEESRGEEKCRHYWMIEPAHGPVSRGVCKLCGAERDFHNIFTATWFDQEDDIPSFMQPGLDFSIEDDDPDKP